MAALTLTLDPALRQIEEPGYRQYFSAQRIRETGRPSSAEDNKRIFADPVTGTLMLYPENLREDWLNTPAQLTSIIRLSSMVIHPDDSTNRTIFEEVAFGNPDNYYVYHSPVGFPGFPSAPRPPGAGPSLTGAPIGDGIGPGLVTIEEQTLAPINTYTDPETPVGDVTTGRVIAYTEERLPVNAPLMFRWAQPHAQIGHQCRYVVFLGQLAIEVLANAVTIYRDVSSAGDRSVFERIWAKEMFGNADVKGFFSSFGISFASESPAQDRYIVIIPYFRNRILLLASNTSAYSIPIKGEPRAAPGQVLTGPPTDAYSFEVTRSDTVAVWCVTPAPGRFQLQRLYYDHEDGVPVRVHLPPVTMDYTPAVAPTVSLNIDQDRGTSIDTNISFPASYSFPVNDLSRCPAPVTAATSGTRSYGVVLNFHGESSHRWTPFFYGLQFASPTTFRNNPATPLTVLDTGAGTANIQEGFVSWGDDPGDGRMECTLIDESPYALAGYYYRAGLLVQLAEAGVPMFTGFAEAPEVIPLHETARPRVIQLIAVDRWKQLVDTYLRDQSDYTGTGHISAVLSIAQQAGIDTVGAEVPSLTNATNTPLGGLTPATTSPKNEARLLNPGWKPQHGDTAADFILRIARQFSGWDVGFRPNGTFYYLPRDWFTALTLRFFHSTAARTAAGAGFENNPLVRDPVEFRTVEPEANVVFAVGGSDKDGTAMFSSLFVDIASIENPNVVNYMGVRKVLPPIELPGVYTCEELNRIARVVFDQVRRRRRFISFQSDFLPGLKLGQRVEVGTYGTGRLRSVKADLERSNWHDATYIVEIDERGYGLP
jgi:hypothetical protein